MSPNNIHPIKIPFSIPVGPGLMVERFVYAYFIDGEPPCLLDTGVAESVPVIVEALAARGKAVCDIGVILLSHSHPDHIGGALPLQSRSGASVWAHSGEQRWIEDTETQARERPVPGFAGLVAGSVKVDRLLEDGEELFPGTDGSFTVLHTPGHSAGSVSLYSEDRGVLFSGDVIPQPGAMPIYEDVAALLHSLYRLAALEPINMLYSSWADPLCGTEAARALHDGILYLQRIHEAVRYGGADEENPMDFCARCVNRLGLPPFAVNPLVARSLMAHRMPGVEEAFAAFSRADI